MTHTLDQAHTLRSIIERSQFEPLRPAGPAVVGLCGGKGGVGTTTVAMRLAQALVRDGRRTVLIDLDSDSSSPTRNGTWQNTPLGEILASRSSIHESLERGPGGVLFLPNQGNQFTGFDTLAAQRFRAMIGELDKFADLVLVDLGRGATRRASELAKQTALTLTVTSPDDLAVMESYSMLKRWQQNACRPRLASVINRVTSEAQAHGVHKRLQRACWRFLGLRLEAAGQLVENARLATGQRWQDQALEPSTALAPSGELDSLVEYVVAAALPAAAR